MYMQAYIRQRKHFETKHMTSETTHIHVPHASFPNIAPDIANNRFMKIRTFASFRRFWDVVMAGDLKLPAILWTNQIILACTCPDDVRWPMTKWVSSGRIEMKILCVQQDCEPIGSQCIYIYIYVYIHTYFVERARACSTTNLYTKQIFHIWISSGGLGSHRGVLDIIRRVF